MNTCIIMHIKIMKSERDDSMVFDQQFEYHGPLTEPHQSVHAEFYSFIMMYLNSR